MMNPIETNIVLSMKRGQEIQLDHFGGFYAGDYDSCLPTERWLIMTVVHRDGRKSRVLARRRQRIIEKSLYELEIRYDYNVRLWVTRRDRS